MCADVCPSSLVRSYSLSRPVQFKQKWTWRVPHNQCIVCTATINTTRFGMDVCRACSSFFKRTKVAGKQYTCRQGNGKCSTAKDEKFVCRGCRFDKCIAIGMEYDGPMRVRRVRRKQEPILKRIKMELRALTERRREKELKLIKQHGGHTRYSHPTEILYFVRPDSCMEIYRIFIEEAYEFFNNVYPAFSALAKKERELIFKEYLAKFGMIENYQRSMRLWGSVTRYQTFSVTTCYDLDWIPIDEDRAAHANIDEVMRYTKNYVEDLSGIYLKIFTRCACTEREYYALMALVMYEMDVECNLSEDAEQILEMCRREALEELHLYYRNDLGLREYSTRLGNLMTANHAVQECMSLFKVFYGFYSIVFDLFMAEDVIREFHL
ncbi:hypothetical protein PRIPAC_80166 [Pristionchus pacificus]|nr:hypothetical protein PRIPAC_80166 [Pristionchus pacificus]